MYVYIKKAEFTALFQQLSEVLNRTVGPTIHWRMQGARP